MYFQKLIEFLEGSKKLLKMHLSRRHTLQKITMLKLLIMPKLQQAFVIYKQHQRTNCSFWCRHWVALIHTFFTSVDIFACLQQVPLCELNGFPGSEKNHVAYRSLLLYLCCCT